MNKRKTENLKNKNNILSLNFKDFLTCRAFFKFLSLLSFKLFILAAQLATL